jgi:heat shock protein HslJ
VVESLITPDAVVTSTALETSAPSLTIGQDGQATGSTGCNRFSGPVRVGASTITFGKLATTRVACPDDVTDVERAVLHVLDGEVTYTVSGPTMELTRPDGTGLHLRGN